MRSTPCLAHYGVTVSEPAVADAELGSAAPGGDAAAGLAFLRSLGFEPLHTNLYPGVGRQWILRRGHVGDAGYLERDLFTSFRADAERAGDDVPRAGDAIFRLPVADPAATLADLRRRGWATTYLGSDALFRGPDAALYELAPITGDQADDRTVSLWTDSDVLDEAVGSWTALFGFVDQGAAGFHDVATARVLRRAGDGAITLNLLTPAGGGALAPRITDDIFAQQGYPHFRLGTPDKAAALAAGEVVFPDTGDVSYLLINGAYVELVQLTPVGVS
jgi:hypothetical protein